jgi:cytochrome c-type biogenesis protein CcmH
LRLLEDETQRELSVRPVQRSFPTWVLMPLIAFASIALYYVLGAAPDVMIVQQLESVDEETTPENLERLIHDIEARSAQRPDNMHYIAMLGRYYMGQEEYSRAAETYDTLVQAAPEDAQALAFAAQAEYLAAGRSLSSRARLRAEQALAANPHQRTALGLLGMASFEQQQYRAAIEYWERLMALETPGSDSAQMIASVIATAKQHLGESNTPLASAAAVDTAAAAVATAPDSAGVTVHVSLPENATISPSDTVFILARNAESDSRMPIAVQRLSAAQLPITLRLDDSNSMAGQKMSETPTVIVAVQVSPDGRPGEASATWLGQVGPLAPSVDGEPLSVVLQAKGR